MSHQPDIDLIMLSIYQNLAETYEEGVNDFAEMGTDAIIERISRVFREHRISRAVSKNIRAY